MPRRLRLCFIGRAMPAHRGGHGMFHPYLMGSALGARGHNVTILTTGHPRGLGEEWARDGVRVIYLNGSPPDRYSDEFWRESAAAFEGLHGDSAFDAVVSDSAGAASVAAQFELPVATVCHAGLDMMRAEPQRRFFREVMHPLLEASRAVVCDAQAAADSVVRGLPSVAGRVRVIRSFVDVARFGRGRVDAGPLRRELGLEGIGVVAYVGRVVPEKGLEDLVHAAAAIEPRPALLVVGPGPHGEALRRLAAGLGVRMVLVPGVPHDSVSWYLAIGDVFALPTRHFEGVPFAVAEACAAGLPVVACDIGGVREVVREGRSGFLVEPGDRGALADRIARLLADPVLRARMGAAGREIARAEFLMETAAERMESVLLEISGAPPGPPLVHVRPSASSISAAAAAT